MPSANLDDVLPVVYAREGLDAPPLRGGAAVRLHREELADGLVVVYVEDGPRGERVLAEEDVAGLRVGKEGLRTRAVANLRRRLGEVDRHGGPDVHLISAGGTYEASLLLVDEFWRPDRVRVDGDFVVAVPGRDLLMVTGTGCPLGIARLRQLAREAFEKGAHPVTTELLVRRDGRWSVLPAWQPTRPAPRLLSRVKAWLRRTRRNS